ncbi:penicillin acylase [Amycolatopsis antarctica]|uniref:Penicillin acylase n=1 Tax=Amycolatopsis antarctica TaxID=1854586 RepID=A0A263D533_9PSEU|nr:penicillin acylase family protein [Amycolatopsis antarctica]OZM72586.1 penicillin acylase [Amycolatopsis antarctica]
MRRRLGTLMAVGAIAAGTVVAVQGPAVAAPAVPAPPTDYCGTQCADILPPGQNGNATLAGILAHKTLGTRPAHSADQLGKYADLGDGYRGLTTDTIGQFFNDASFGVPDEAVESTEQPREDVTITRDKATGVPHIAGTTREGTEFGAGYAAAQDRLWLMDVLRHVGRGQLTPFAGGAEGNRELEQSFFATAPYTEEELQQQIDSAVAGSGDRGQQALADVTAYVEGINAYIAKSDSGRYFPGEYVLTGHKDAITNSGEIEPFKLTDLVVLAAVVGAQFGAGGGDEVQAAVAKLAIQEQYGLAEGEKVWQALRSENDPEHVNTLHDGQSFPYAQTPADPQGTAMPDAGSVVPQQLVFDPTGSAADGQQAPAVTPAGNATNPDGTPNLDAARGMFDDGVLPGDMLSGAHGMSNALAVSGEHTESGNPVAVWGPQTGYFAPQLLMLQELQGPGISARGASFAGLSFYVLLGRGQDYSWSATTSAQDITDTYALELCDPNGGTPTVESNAYLSGGQCVPMETVERKNAWKPTVADGTPEGSYTLRSFRTEYGPVTSRGTVGGAPVAYAALRSSYLHEVDSIIGFQQFNDPDVIKSAQDFQRAASDINYTFNWLYADADDTAYFNSGDNPVRDPAVDPSMPIRAHAGFDWQGWDPAGNKAQYTPFEQHPNSVNQDYYVSWNNGQAEDYASAGLERGAVHRGDLLDARVKGLIDSGTKVNRVNLTQAMAEAGLADLRTERVLPLLIRVLESSPVDDPKTAEALRLLKEWQADGGLRQQTEPGSKAYRHAEAIKIMDAWWPLLVDGSFTPSMGDAAFEAMTNVLQINQSPSGFQNDTPGEHLGQPHQGSAYQFGWWGYLHKDLRSLLGDEVRAPMGTPYCGSGDLGACRQVLAGSLNAAVDQPIAQVYPGDDTCEAGDQWCADALVHRALGGITQDEVSTQNRPTFQQVAEFPSRRPATR